MRQIDQDAIIMRQIFEKVLEVLYDNDVMYNRSNIARMAQILMALSVNMIGMSSNDVPEFRRKAQKMVNDMTGMLDNMDSKKREELMSAVDEQINWFEKAYDKQKEDFEEEQAAFLNKTKDKDIN